MGASKSISAAPSCPDVKRSAEDFDAAYYARHYEDPESRASDAAAIERYVRRQEMRQLLDMMTSILGVSAGTLGIKAAATLDVGIAKRFRSFSWSGDV